MKKYLPIFCSVLLFITGGVFFFLNIGTWLSLSEQPRKADIIICLNSSPARVARVAELYQQGYADKVLVTYANTGLEVVKQGVPVEDVLSLDSKPESTFAEARGVIRFMNRQVMRSAIIVSDPYHMYRSKWSFEFLADEESMHLTYTAAGSSGDTPWWEEKKNRLFVLREIPKIAYYWVAHGLFKVEKDPQWVVAAEQWYNRMLWRFA